MKTANSKWLALRYNYTLRLHRLLVCYSLLPRCWRAEWGARTGSFSVLLCRWIHMAIHNRLFQKSYYHVKWARGSTYSQYKGHQVGAHWKSDATSETCKGRELFFFSLLSRVSRAALQTVVQASPPKELSQLAIYTIVTCVGARLNRTDTTFFLSLIHFFRCIYCLLSCWP